MLSHLHRRVKAVNLWNNISKEWRYVVSVIRGVPLLIDGDHTAHHVTVDTQKFTHLTDLVLNFWHGSFVVVCVCVCDALFVKGSSIFLCLETCRAWSSILSAVLKQPECRYMPETHISCNVCGWLTSCVVCRLLLVFPSLRMCCLDPICFSKESNYRRSNVVPLYWGPLWLFTVAMSCGSTLGFRCCFYHTGSVFFSSLIHISSFKYSIYTMSHKKADACTQRCLILQNSAHSGQFKFRNQWDAGSEKLWWSGSTTRDNRWTPSIRTHVPTLNAY